MTLLFHIHVQLIHGNATLVLVSLLYRYSTLYYMYLSHGFTCVHALIVSVFLLQWIAVLVTWILLYSCYMTISCNPDMVLLLQYMWAVDIWCVKLSAKWIKATWATSRIPHLPFLFPVILFHAINRAHVLLSCYMYHALYLFLIHCVVLLY